MSDNVYSGGLTWTSLAGSTGAGLEAKDQGVLLLVESPRSGEQNWHWRTRHGANLWCGLEGDADSRALAMKIAQQAISYVDRGLMTDAQGARSFPKVWERWLRDHSAE